jgi:hypothetical protein
VIGAITLTRGFIPIRYHVCYAFAVSTDALPPEDFAAFQQATERLFSAARPLWGLGDQVGPPNLFHYTSLENAFQILGTRTLWASDVLSLNDASELAYGTALMLSVLRSHDGVPDGVKKVMAPILESDLDVTTVPWDNLTPRVCCFCSERDLLSQWRAYGKSGGVAIGFDRDALSSRITFDRGVHHPQLSAAYLVRVLYDPDEQERLCRCFIDAALLEAQALSNRVSVSLFWRLAASPWFHSRFIVRCKDAVFSEEAEWRLAIEIPGSTRFRTTSRMIVPYSEVTFEPTAVRMLCLGPTATPENVARRSLGMFLYRSGYPDVEIVNSRIPLRSL